MLVLDKLNSKPRPGFIKKVVIRKSRVEIITEDGEFHYYMDEAFSPDDELSVFSTRMRNKFLDGRDRHEAQGSPTYKADTIRELQGELLDQGAYSAILFFELERLKKAIDYKPTARKA